MSDLNLKVKNDNTRNETEREQEKRWTENFREI